MYFFRSMFIIVSCVALLAGNALGTEDMGKTAYVDMSEVFKNYYKTAQYQKALKRQEDVYKEKAEEMGNKIKELKKKRNKLEDKSLNVALSEEARNQHKQEAQSVEQRYQAKQQQLRKYLENKQQALRKRYMDKRKNIVDEITEYIKSYADKNDIEVVFDVSGLTNNLLPVVIHYPESKEITQKVIEQLNEGHEKPDTPANVGAPDIKE